MLACYIALARPMLSEKPNSTILDLLVALLLALLWIEVLEHESALEQLDRRCKRAHFQKRQRVRYMQNSIITY